MFLWQGSLWKNWGCAHFSHSHGTVPSMVSGLSTICGTFLHCQFSLRVWCSSTDLILSQSYLVCAPLTTDQKCRDDLLSYLRPFAQEGKVVGEYDIRTFFEERMAARRAQASR